MPLTTEMTRGVRALGRRIALAREFHARAGVESGRFWLRFSRGRRERQTHAMVTEFKQNGRTHYDGNLQVSMSNEVVAQTRNRDHGVSSFDERSA